MKIAILGIGGSGKSVCGRKVAEKTGLPLYHMDNLFWKGNWEAVPEAEYLIQHAELVKKDSWIIEGYINESMSDRVKLADLILYLDYPDWLCFWRVLKRWLMHRNEARPELPKEALERLSPHFLWVVLSRAERPDIEIALKYTDVSRVVRIHSPKELETFINIKFA